MLLSYVLYFITEKAGVAFNSLRVEAWITGDN
jgi:hypothetical protein